jgi:hypothetical protein
MVGTTVGHLACANPFCTDLLGSDMNLQQSISVTLTMITAISIATRNKDPDPIVCRISSSLKSLVPPFFTSVNLSSQNARIVVEHGNLGLIG